MIKKNAEAAPDTAIVKAAKDATLIPLTAANIIQYVNDKASKEEVVIFLNLCQVFQLNPFKREIYLIKYDPKDKAAYVVGYESYLKRADRTHRWSGMESGTTDNPKVPNQPEKAWAKVFRKDWAAPLYHEVYFSEYAQYTREGKLTKFWREKPRTMLKKVAIAQALRMAFPDEFGGMPYTSEEMPVEHAALPTAEVKAGKKADPAMREPDDEPKIGGETGPSQETPDDIADMAETQAPELDEAGMKKHLSNVQAVKLILEKDDIDYKDFKKFLAEIQARSKSNRVFVRDKFNHPSLEAGNADDVAQLLDNLGVMMKKYIATKMEEEKNAKTKKKG